MLKRTIAPLILCAVAVTSCSSDPVPTNGPVPVNVPDRPMRKVPDSQVVAKAVDKLRHDRTGKFSSSLYIAGQQTGYVDSSGVFDIPSRSSLLKLVSVSNKGKRTAFEYRIFADGYSVRVSKGKDKGCWESVSTAGTVLPSQVQALLGAEGDHKRSREGGAAGTVRLGDAAGLLGPSWSEGVRAAGLAAMQQPLRVRFAVEHGEFVGWSVKGRALITAFEKANMQLPPGQRPQLRKYVVEVELKAGGKVDVRRPAATC